MEARYPPVALEQTPAADVAIVLGGAVGPVGDPPRENLEDASDRVLRAARLFRAGKVRQVLVSGGNLPWLAGSVPEAESIRDLLVEWGAWGGLRRDCQPEHP
jgi:vancomycin permeability regulator SanA